MTAEDSRPEVLYKYRALDENTIKTITDEYVWFSAPSHFNDPFDCQLEIGNDAPSKQEHQAIVARRLQNLERETGVRIGFSEPAIDIYDGDFLSQGFCQMVYGLREHLQSELQELGVLSLAANYDSTTMWGHYADSHRGICIGYKTREMFADDHLHEYTIPVEYKSASDISFNVFELYEELNVSMSRQSTESAIFNRLLSTKVSDWEYEDEWRIVKKGMGGISIEPHAIESICFGVNCSDDDKATIRDLIRRTQSTVTYYQMIKSTYTPTLERVLMDANSPHWP